MLVNLLLDPPLSEADFNGKVLISADTKHRIVKLADFLVAVATGNGSCGIVMQVGAVKASGTVTLASVLAADTVTINGVVLTAVAGAPAANQFSIDGTDTVDAASFIAAVAANATLAGLVTASQVAGVVTLSAKVPGVSGNAITLASSNGTRLAVSAARLASGADGTSYTLTVGQ